MKKIKFNDRYVITYHGGMYGLRENIVRVRGKTGETYPDEHMIYTNNVSLSKVMKRLALEMTAETLSDGDVIGNYLEKYNETTEKIEKITQRLINEGSFKLV